MPRTDRIAMIAGVFACSMLFGFPPASAEDAPRSYVASPEVYKVIADNGKTKVILATWPPGKRITGTRIPPPECTGSPIAMHGSTLRTENPWRTAVRQEALSCRRRSLRIRSKTEGQRSAGS